MTDKDHKPRAIFIDTGTQCRIQTVSPAAAQMGVAPLMPLSAAFALCSTLVVTPYDSHAESLQLRKIATWAERFTPMVSLEPPRSLLLEVRGSLRLFGGLDSLRAKIRKHFTQTWSHRFCLAIAPTPMASVLLARYGQETVVAEQAALRSVLGRLPIDVVFLDAKLLKRLKKIGVQHLRDLWRLPRDGLARRFGPGLLRYLDRVLGVLADPRNPYKTTQKFMAKIDLPMEVKNTRFIFMAAKKLITQLLTFLRERDAAVSELSVYLYHLQRPPTELTFGLRYMSRDAAQLLSLLEEHLNRLQLSAPVFCVGLSSQKIGPFIRHNEALFASPLAPLDSQLVDKEQGEQLVDKEQDDPHWQGLLEQLQGRLGRDAINGLSVQADHRPEHAWRYTELGAPGDMAMAHRRPLWLLPAPICLREHSLTEIVSGPERIEGGWWQGQDIRRDYYTALDKKGRRLWVFRDLMDKHWYLHGLFA